MTAVCNSLADMLATPRLYFFLTSRLAAAIPSLNFPASCMSSSFGSLHSPAILKTTYRTPISVSSAASWVDAFRPGSSLSRHSTSGDVGFFILQSLMSLLVPPTPQSDTASPPHCITDKAQIGLSTTKTGSLSDAHKALRLNNGSAPASSVGGL